MKELITILFIVAALYVAKNIFSFWQTFGSRRSDQEAASAPANSSAALPGLPPAYEASLQAAKQQGAAGLGKWLRQYIRVVADPRLADVQLDYVVLVNQTDPVEARRVFAAVKQRTVPSSPVYSRVKLLSKTYE